MKKVFYLSAIVTLLYSCSSSNTNSESEEFDPMAILGKNINSADAQSMIGKLGAEKEISKYDDASYFNYKKKGISICVNNHDSIKAVFQYSEGSANYNQFTGKIVGDLTFTMTRKDVNQKLGQPKFGGGAGVIDYEETYEFNPNLLISVGYKLKDTLDMNNPIKVIGLHHR